MRHPKAIGLMSIEIFDEEEIKKVQARQLQSAINLGRVSIARQYDTIIEFMFNIDNSISSDGIGFCLEATLDDVKLKMGENNLVVRRRIGMLKLTPEDLYSMIIEIYFGELMES